MGESVTIKDRGHSYTAAVADGRDLSSPVVVTSGKYTVRFDGNDFATKHLRRIRRGSVTELKKGDIGGKLDEFMAESKNKALNRFAGNGQATSTFIFLDLEQFCQFGCNLIKFLDSDQAPWQVFGNGGNQCLQKHTHITINKCFASSNSGFGPVRENANNPQRLQHGIGITFTVTVKQPMGGNGCNVQVCHYAGGGVSHEFSPETTSIGRGKLKSIGQSVVT